MNVACICGHHKDDHDSAEGDECCQVEGCDCPYYEAEEFIG